MKYDLDHCDRISLARRTNRSTTVRTLSEYSACMLCIGRPSGGLFSVRVAQRNCKIQQKPYPSPNSTQCDLDWRASSIIVNLKVIRSVSQPTIWPRLSSIYLSKILKGSTNRSSFRFPLPSGDGSFEHFHREMNSSNVLLLLRHRGRHNCRLPIVRRDRTVPNKIAVYRRNRFARRRACELRNSQYARVKRF